MEGQEVGDRLNVDEIAGVTGMKLKLKFDEHILNILLYCQELCSTFLTGRCEGRCIC
jgi:hypothetical protein